MIPDAPVSPPLHQSTRLCRWKKILLWLVGVLVFYSVVGFWVLPAMLRYLVVEKGAAVMQRPVTVARIDFNPYTLVLTVNQFNVGDREEGGETFIGFQRLRVDLEAASLVKRALIVRSLQLVRPACAIFRNSDGSYNFSDFLTGKAETDDAQAPAKATSFSINNIEITGGGVDFLDRRKGTMHRVRNLHLTLPFFANMDHLVETFVTPVFEATVNGTPIKMTAKAKPFVESRESELEFRCRSVDLTRYLMYLPPDLGVGLRSGSLDGDFVIAFMQKGNGRRLTVGGSLSLSDLAVTDRDHDDLFTLKRATITLLPSDLLRDDIDIHLAAIALDAPHLLLNRRADNSLNLHDLLVAGGADETSGQDASPGEKFTGAVKVDRLAVTDASVTYVGAGDGQHDAGGAEELVSLSKVEFEKISVDCKQRQIRLARLTTSDGLLQITRSKDGGFLWQNFVPAATGEGTSEAEKVAADGWEVSLEHLDFHGYGLQWLDLAVPEPVRTTVANLSLQAHNLSTVAATPADISLGLAVNGKGRVQVDGQLAMAPFAAGLDVALSALAIKPFFPYLASYLDMLVASGEVSAKGRLQLASGQAPQIRFQGQAAVDNLATRDSLLAEPLLSWHSLQFDGVDLAVAPTSLEVDSITLDQPYARLVVSDQGKVNFRAALKMGDSSQDELVGAGENVAEAAVLNNESEPMVGANHQPPLVQINTVSCRNGRFDFEDRSIPSGYKVSLGDFNGQVSGLSSLAEKVAEVDFSGKLDQHSPLAISGTIKPLQKNLMADLVVRSNDIGMSALSPYTGKYIGYRLLKGKLGLDLRYRIAHRQLDAENKIFMDQLTLGEAVVSPDAVDLPIRLAIALLQNRAGEIKLDVPLHGNIDDPEFSLASTLVGVVVNLIAKAVTSPFALLGALVGGGEELQFVDFAPGRAVLADQGGEKLTSLATVLRDRPALKLDITGRADNDQDQQALLELFFQRLLKAEKLKKMVKESGVVDLTAVDQVEIVSNEFQEYLGRAYKAASFQRPRNILGLLKRQSMEEMERLLREHIKVTTADRLDLANRRAAVVKNFLIGEGGIAVERLFLLDARPEAEGGGSEPAVSRRVELAIR